MSKAEVLSHLRAHRTSFVIDDFVYFSGRRWHADARKVIDEVHAAGLGPFVAIRSSGAEESLHPSASPGWFHTELGVAVSDEGAVATAIDKVLGSMAVSSPDGGGVMVQTQLRGAAMAGVVTSRTPSGTPYLIVEYDASGRTDAVTSGHHPQRVVLTTSARRVPEPWDAIQLSVQEISSLLGLDDLVVEFGLDAEGKVHIFQVWDRGRDEPGPPLLGDAVHSAERSLNSLRRATTGPLILSDMTDWNPAEMLGPRPARLDIDLYATLITDRTWAEARAALGYVDCAGSLMVRLDGQPYIDVPRSFRSLVAAATPEPTRETYVSLCLDRLAEEPALHDKVEHEILTTYWPLDGQVTSVAGDLPHRHAVAFERALRDLTSAVLSRWDPLLAWAERSGRSLAGWRLAHPFDQDEDTYELPALIEEGIDRCRELGTLPFAMVARLAFIADGLVRELVAKSGDDGLRSAFWSGINTPAQRLALALADRTVATETITATFGHLRPHAYNLESRPYAARPSFLEALRGARPETDPAPTRFSASSEAALHRYASDLGVMSGPGLHRLAAAVAAREEHKFIFSAVLSDVLERLALLGERLGLSRSDVRALGLRPLLELARSGNVDVARHEADQARAREDLRHEILFPDVVLPESRLAAFEYVQARPTYVTQDVVRSRIWRLETVPDAPSVIDGQIVAIESADPGFDWIFSRPIAGLITCYGGSSSHMAIRCQELAIPASIGCGAPLFSTLTHLGSVVLDCRHANITSVSPW